VGDDENGKTGHRERLRERFLHGDAFSRTDAALLELLLTFGIPRRDVQPLAAALLARFGDLHQVLAADPAALRTVDGVEAHVTNLLKLVDHITQARSGSRPASGSQEHPGTVVAPTPAHRVQQRPIRLQVDPMIGMPEARSPAPGSGG